MRNNQSDKKWFFTKGPVAIFGFVWMFIFGPVIGYLFYAFVFKMTTRLIRFHGNRIRVFQDAVLLNVYQYRIDILLEDVLSIQFKHVYGNSRREWFPGAQTAPCIEFVLKNGTIERMMLTGFSKKQYQSIEYEILRRNKNIESKAPRARYFIEKYGYY